MPFYVCDALKYSQVKHDMSGPFVIHNEKITTRPARFFPVFLFDAAAERVGLTLIGLGTGCNGNTHN